MPHLPDLDWPLMRNNILRSDLDELVRFLGGDPILTANGQVREFERAVVACINARIHPLVANYLNQLGGRIDAVEARRLYALPLNAVSEIARTVEEDIHQVEHYDVLQLRNDVLPLLRLGSKPPNGVETARRKVFVLVINSGDRKFGVIVDELAGEEELVIKALDDQSITTDLVSGASILGDGRVVLILNMIALLDRFTRGRADTTSTGMAGLLSSAAQRKASGGGTATAEMRAQGMAGGKA